jgi:hypothetical protein
MIARRKMRTTGSKPEAVASKKKNLTESWSIWAHLSIRNKIENGAACCFAVLENPLIPSRASLQPFINHKVLR